MKKLLLSTLGLMTFANSFAQFNTVWPAPAATNTSNATNAGYVGLGIRPLTTSTNLPTFNFQVHGTMDWIVDNTQTGMATYGGSIPIGTNLEKAISTNFGKTVTFGLTNSTAGLLATDGTVFRQYGVNFDIYNQETGTMNLSTGGNFSIIASTKTGIANPTNFTISGGKAFFGSVSPNLETTQGALNVLGVSKNGLQIKTTNATHYGLSIIVPSNIADAFVVESAIVPGVGNFKVKGNGEVYARKYTTTLASFPDYVFNDNYKLLSFQELRTYLDQNNRLPNMPSATQVETDGADLGELNRLLVEKVEELTLYILQLEERTKALENVK